VPVNGDSPLALSATERNWVHPTRRVYTFKKISLWKLRICIGTHPKQASIDRSIGRHDPGLHEAVRIGLGKSLVRQRSDAGMT
jgi:hypothetical protein